MGERLTTQQAAALTTLKHGGYFAPERAARPPYHQLIDLGLAVWGGYGLGGESFAITDKGRAALKDQR